MIAKLSSDQIHEIFEIFEACKHSMEREQIFQWTNAYPNVEIVTCDITNGNSYGWFIDGKCCGVVTINTDEEPQYDVVNWDDKGGSIMVVHRLAILPSHQKQGIGSELMDFAESHVRQNGCTSISFGYV